METIVKALDKYNIETYIKKLRHLSNERIILSQKLDELRDEYMGLEKANIDIKLKSFCK